MPGVLRIGSSLLRGGQRFVASCGCRMPIRSAGLCAGLSAWFMVTGLCLVPRLEACARAAPVIAIPGTGIQPPGRSAGKPSPARRPVSPATPTRTFPASPFHSPCFSTPKRFLLPSCGPRPARRPQSSRLLILTLITLIAKATRQQQVPSQKHVIQITRAVEAQVLIPWFGRPVPGAGLLRGTPLAVR